MRLNLKIIFSILGLLLIINGLFMLLCLPFSFYYEENEWRPILVAGLVNMLAGAVIRLFTGRIADKSIKKREGYIIVSLGWIVMSLSGCLPYITTGAIPDFTDAFFETISGYTTTGASILTDIEALPKSVLFLRSLTHWIGGMGIIVLTVAILPILGIGGMQLFIAESPGITPEKLHPRITETAKRLWLIYVLLSILETGLLMIGGMDFYDAINHTMATMATGGFSTKNASVAFYESPFIHYVIMIFLFLAGMNFTLTYFAFKGRIRKIAGNEEFRAYLFTILAAIALTTISVYLYTGHDLERSFRDSAFQVISIITTTGFVTADYTAWAPFITVLFFILFFTGGSAGSTAGGIKMVRHVVLIKNSFLELKRQIHPAAVIPVRFNGKAVSPVISFNIMAFILIYLLIFFTGSLLMSVMGLEFMTSMGAVAATLGNIGPGIGGVGPVDNYAFIPQPGKWLLSFLMLIGRLELFTVLILFTPYFWARS